MRVLSAVSFLEVSVGATRRARRRGGVGEEVPTTGFYENIKNNFLFFQQ